MQTPPTGTVTFLFTDIEGSTRLWDAHPEAMKAAVALHDKLLRQTIEMHEGFVFKTIGDAFCAAFATAPDALAAAADSQRALRDADWGELDALRVRMALNTGHADERDRDYFGPALNRVARLLALGHGGQVLVSQASEELLRDDLAEGFRLDDLGEHQLRDLGRRQRVFQLSVEGLESDHPPLRSVNALPNNLPVNLSSFIGREAEIEQIRTLLDETRLLTLTGVGGTGKTRLALQVGAERLHRHADGVWFVGLASLVDEEQVARELASALDIRERANEPIEDTLTKALAGKEMLLIFDNCEHLIQACAELAETLLKKADGLSVLATSREGLGIMGERLLAIRSLKMPPAAKRVKDSEDLLDATRASSAAQLFVERAKAVQPNFELSRDNARAVSEVCRRLDGIPLAIELAAARARVLPPEKLAERLDKRFQILTGGSRTALPRQQTLAATIAWSYDLLDENEQALLMRLSVFSGGCDLEAAEAVCAGEPLEDWEVLDALSGLVGKSLVMVRDESSEPRYTLLETVRQFSRDQLLDSGDIQKWRLRHLQYFENKAHSEQFQSFGPDRSAWSATWLRDLDNVRAALVHARETGSSFAAMHLLSSLNVLLWSHGLYKNFDEVIDWVLAEGQGQASADEWAKFQTSVVISRDEFGGFGRAGLNRAESIIDWVSEHANPLWRAKVLNIIGRNRIALGHLREAMDALEEAEGLLASLGLKGGERYMLDLNDSLLFNLDQQDYVAQERRDWHRSLELCRRIREEARRLNIPVYVSMGTNNSGLALFALGRVEEAIDVYREVIALDESNPSPGGANYARSNLAECDMVLGDLESARKRLDVAKAGYEALNMPETHWRGQYGRLELHCGNLDAAREHIMVEFELYAALESSFLMKTIFLLADLALAEHRPLVALTLLGAVYELSPFHAPAEGLTPKDLDISLVYEAELQKALESLADEDVQAALATGRTMSYAEIVRYAREQFGEER